jgi:hypothetical protein
MRLPKDVSMQPAEIVFFPKGDSTGGRLVITDQEKNEYEVEVDRTTGAARLSGPHAS